MVYNLFLHNKTLGWKPNIYIEEIRRLGKLIAFDKKTTEWIWRSPF